MNREEIAQGCIDQAGWCAKLGSPMYEALLRRVSGDVLAGGPCFAVMERCGAAQRLTAPLLLLAAIHRMVLEGKLPEAQRYYPSVNGQMAGGEVNVDALWPHFLEAVPRATLPACVQTNEIGRSRALLPGFLEIAARTSLPLRLLEIGASAGLNLRWDQFAFLDAPAKIRIAERRGCDLNPIDPALDDSRLALLSFIWPDQVERLRQFAEALEIAKRIPAPVVRRDAVEWLREQLADARPGVASVVFHSVVMMYLSEEGRENVRRVIEDAGRRATPDAPLAWLSMEAGKDQADVHLTMWPGGERRLIAQSSYHGLDVKVL